MNAHLIMPLDDNWAYFFADNRRADYSDANLDVSGWIPLPRLSDWAVTSSDQDGADWFRRVVELGGTDFCANYILRIDTVPKTVSVYVNGKPIGHVQGGQSFQCDITNDVALGRNVIAMQLLCLSNTFGGSFGKIYLQPVPCE